jgi:hypothetical protein
VKIPKETQFCERLEQEAILMHQVLFLAEQKEEEGRRKKDTRGETPMQQKFSFLDSINSNLAPLISISVFTPQPRSLPHLGKPRPLLLTDFGLPKRPGMKTSRFVPMPCPLPLSLSPLPH